MSIIELHLEDQIIKKVKLPADDLANQLEAVDVLRNGLAQTIVQFNKAQVSRKKKAISTAKGEKYAKTVVDAP